MSIIMHQSICFNVSVIRKNANETRPELMYPFKSKILANNYWCCAKGKIRIDGPISL